MLPMNAGPHAELALVKGWLLVPSSPLTRSSYHAREDFAKMKAHSAALRKARENRKSISIALGRVQREVHGVASDAFFSY
jgi:hypothetical protein